MESDEVAYERIANRMEITEEDCGVLDEWTWERLILSLRVLEKDMAVCEHDLCGRPISRRLLTQASLEREDGSIYHPALCPHCAYIAGLI